MSEQDGAAGAAQDDQAQKGGEQQERPAEEQREKPQGETRPAGEDPETIGGPGQGGLTSEKLPEDHHGSQAGTGAGLGDVDRREQAREEPRESKEPELGDTVYLFERNHDPATGELKEGYQAPKQGVLVKLNDETGVADIKVGGEDSAPETSHDVPHRTSAGAGDGNYWSETAE